MLVCKTDGMLHVNHRTDCHCCPGKHVFESYIKKDLIYNLSLFHPCHDGNTYFYVNCYKLVPDWFQLGFSIADLFHITQLHHVTKLFVVLYLSEGVWKWADGTLAPLPTATWHDWFDGEPDDNLGEDCAIITNYMFWDIYFRRTIDHYVWLDYRCTSVNAANEIQGYICEGELSQ